MNHSLKQGDSMNSGSDCQDKPYSEVRDFVNQLETQTSRLNNILQDLRSRLEPVLVQVPVDPCKTGASLALAGPQTKLGSDLATILNLNATTCENLQELISRIHC